MIDERHCEAFILLDAKHCAQFLFSVNIYMFSITGVSDSVE